MAINPIVRYMLLCDDWRLDGPSNRRVSIIGLIWNIHSVEEPPYPLFYRELCVFLALTAGRGQGEGHIVCIFEDSGEKVFETRKRSIPFGTDPLDVVGVPFRIRDCSFPWPGRYSMQFWYNGAMLEERPVRLR
ncbi:MAG: DUF6941 family protein [Fimbriiglobus sp.]